MIIVVTCQGDAVKKQAGHSINHRPGSLQNAGRSNNYSQPELNKVTAQTLLTIDDGGLCNEGSGSS